MTQAAKIRALKPEERILNSIPEKPVKVHFRIIEATEGEHGNVRASETTKRYFIIHKEKPVATSAEGELIVNFEYRPDPEKTGQEGTWRVKRNNESVEIILAALADMIKQDSRLDIYDRLLKFPAPTESERNRPLLVKYVNQYTARNTMDYFIHKDLGGFLKRELDFYIKNEVMRLDDIENAEAPAVDSYLAKIKVLRKIAGKLIAFLAQLEEFQKKLWLKKKFVVETNYCMTLDRVQEELYPEIAANDAQHDEWIKLFAIDEIAPDTTGNPGYSKPLTVEFLKANNKLVLDTQYFDDGFKSRLLASVENFDEQCDGLLIQAENFQALNLIEERYQKQVKCVHIDPPYNTATSGFLYKNEYQHSSWLAMMEDRIMCSIPLLLSNGSFLCHIDENEYESLHHVFQKGALPNAGTTIWDKKNPMLGRKGIATQHEYIIWRTYVKGPVYNRNANFQLILREADKIVKEHNGVTKQAREKFARWISSTPGLTGGERAYKLIADDGRVYQSVGMAAPEPRTNPKFHIPLIHPITKKPCPVPINGWSRSPETIQDLIDKGIVIFGTDENVQPRLKVYLTNESQRQVSSVIQDASRGKADVEKLGLEFPYCHPLSLYVDLIGACAESFDDIVLDHFAGSGTNGNAVINLNREDGGKRKYILVEMGDYFDTVMKPRIAKVVYSSDWNDGKPTARETGISHCFKYLRLESYEDTLNNLRFEESPVRDRSIQSKIELKEDYMLNYLLDVETRDSQSLLNIDAFADPTAYKLKVKKPGTDEYVVRNVDLMETFNYLIGLRLNHIAEPQVFTASFTRLVDPEVPKDQKTKLVIDGKIQQVKVNQRKSENPVWWFRKLEGWLSKDTANPDNGQREKVLVVWRNLTGDLEKDNVMLDEWFQKNRISTHDFEYDIIYVNGSNNLPNLMQEGDNWKVRLIEEEFMKRMWETAK